VSHKEDMEQPGTMHTCWKCGTPIIAGQQFCHNCGSPLSNQQLQEQHSATVPLLYDTPVYDEHTHRIDRDTGPTVAGIILGGRYRIISIAGVGGYATIYEAQDTRFQSRRVVAVKEMSGIYKDAHETMEALQSFRKEAEILAQLKHSNMPDVKDFFEENGKAYLVMEFIVGMTLEKKLELAGGPLNETLVMRWGLQLCDVLNYLHSCRPPIIFRDLKPSNVMVTQEGNIKLIDFGIARIFKPEGKEDTSTLGSRSYAAPEQYGLGQSDARTDIYTLGATLYKLLTGVTPLESPLRQSNPALFHRPRELNPGLSVATDQIILTAMNLHPNDRFQTASDMFNEIEASGVELSLAEGVFPDTGPHIFIEPPKDEHLLTSSGLPPASHRAPPVLPPAPDMPAPAHSPTAPQPEHLSRRKLIAAGVGAAGILALGTAAAYFFSNRGSNTIGSNPAGTISLPFTCSTEKVDWMTAAVNAFHASNATLNGKTIQIDLDLRGSVDAQQKILNGTIQPIIWSPASFLELNQLSSAWEQAHGNKDIIILSGNLQPKELVLSPLVFAVWQDRSQLLLRQYGSIDWPSIHDALKLNNWSDIGGQSQWGPVKFGHTRPDSSNSGLLTITLMAYSFFKEQRDLTIQQIDDAQFLSYFNDIEAAVSAFGRSSGTFLTNVVIPEGPPDYDIVATYENLILTNNKAAVAVQQQPLQLFYPSLNIVSDHPLAILQGTWVTHEQQLAAQIFRDFLLAEPQQRLALATGFRPANVNVHITDNTSGNVFLRQSSYNITPRPTIQPVAQVPTSAVINELIKEWKTYYSGSATALG